MIKFRNASPADPEGPAGFDPLAGRGREIHGSPDIGPGGPN
jgi:hypothetical protein